MKDHTCFNCGHHFDHDENPMAAVSDEIIICPQCSSTGNDDDFMYDENHVDPDHDNMG